MSAPDIVLLDTSVVVEHLRRKDPNIAQRLKEPRILYIPLIARGEMLLGAHASSAPKVLQETRAFLSICALLAPDDATSELYGRIGADLQRKGKKIPTNDLWIAAMALQHNLPLAARDFHFSQVTGLTILQW
jgi:tRNA(fMet)-specific endonuclease VapC